MWFTCAAGFLHNNADELHRNLSFCTFQRLQQQQQQQQRE
jgi:hypothetical protein